MFEYLNMKIADKVSIPKTHSAGSLSLQLIKEAENRASNGFKVLSLLIFVDFSSGGDKMAL